MTGDTDSELYFSVLYASFAEAEVHRFISGVWSPATFDGKTILYTGYFNAKWCIYGYGRILQLPPLDESGLYMGSNRFQGSRWPRRKQQLDSFEASS